MKLGYRGTGISTRDRPYNVRVGSLGLPAETVEPADALLHSVAFVQVGITETNRKVVNQYLDIFYVDVA